MSEFPCFELPLTFLAEFQDKLRYSEEKYRHVLDPAEKIMGLLNEMSDFYAADCSFLLEMDWDLGVGICTYAQCNSEPNPEINVFKQIPVDHFDVWINKIRANQPVIMDMEKMGSHAGAPQEFTWKGLKKVLIVPFSNRFNTGIIGIGNPKNYANNLTFLQLLGYAIVAALNEIKLQERVDEAVKQISICPDNVIDVSCFGGLTIRSHQGVLNDEAITADQCHRLLAYLICNHKKARPARELAEIIWNDAPISDPYRDLKNVVYRLKRFLNIIELDDLIIGSGGTFIINPKYTIITDYDRFEAACNKFGEEIFSGNMDEAFINAKEMYKGILLPRCDHIHWFMPRIGYYHTLYLNLLKQYIGKKIEKGDYLTAQKIAMEGLEAEPYDTDFMAFQIIAMYAMGNRSMARSYYKRIELQLTDEQKEKIKKYK